jgi:hypothetical protein
MFWVGLQEKVIKTYKGNGLLFLTFHRTQRRFSRSFLLEHRTTVECSSDHFSATRSIHPSSIHPICLLRKKNFWRITRLLIQSSVDSWKNLMDAISEIRRDVLLSIRPQYASKILDGRKTVEFDGSFQKLALSEPRC